MRLALLSTASMLALATVPALAGDDFTGNLQLNIGRASIDGTPYTDDPFIYGGKAKGLWPLSPEIHLQADLFAEEYVDIVDNWGPQNDADASVLGGALHILHPFGDRARFGLAGSIWNSDAFVPAGNGKTDITYGLAALEGQFFGTDWTVMVQGGAFTSFDCNDGGESCTFALEDGTFLRGKIRYFLTDNTALSLETTRMWGGRADDVFGLKNLDSERWTLEAEHRFTDSGFSAFANVSHESVDGSFISFGTDAVAGMIGVKFYYDQASIRSNDRGGAEMDTPTFGTAPILAGTNSSP